MKSPELAEQPGHKFLGGWIPDKNPSTVALLWRVTHAAQTHFLAEISRSGEPLKTLEAATLEALAKQLIETCGMAQRSMVRLGIPLPS